MLSLAFKSMISKKMHERERALERQPNWGNLPFPAIKIIAQ